MANDQPLDQSDLVDRWVQTAAQDRKSFGQLFDLFYPQIFAYCSRRLLVRAVAEDVTSEVFLKVAKAIASFQGSTAEYFRRWLFRITTNEINAWLRKSIRQQSLRCRNRACRLVTAYLLIVISDTAGDGQRQRFADRFDRDAVEHLLEESSHDRADGFLAGVASALSVED